VSRLRREGIKVPPTEGEAGAVLAAYKLLTEGALRVQQRFTKPDDDWWPIWLTLTRTQGTILTPERFAPQDKQPTVAAVARWARRVGAVCVGHLHSSWTVIADQHGGRIPVERMQAIHRQMVAQHGSTVGIPERMEVVMVALHTASGSAMHVADIERHAGAPPTLAPFRLLVDEHREGDDSGMEGVMIDPLREAVWRRG